MLEICYSHSCGEYVRTSVRTTCQPQLSYLYNVQNWITLSSEGTPWESGLSRIFSTMTSNTDRMPFWLPSIAQTRSIVPAVHNECYIHHSIESCYANNCHSVTRPYTPANLFIIPVLPEHQSRCFGSTRPKSAFLSILIVTACNRKGCHSTSDLHCNLQWCQWLTRNGRQRMQQTIQVIYTKDGIGLNSKLQSYVQRFSSEDRQRQGKAHFIIRLTVAEQSISLKQCIRNRERNLQL